MLNFLSTENKAILLTNVKSFGLRLAFIGATMGVDFLSDNLHLFNLAPGYVVVLGLLLGEVHDFLNQKYSIDAKLSKQVAKMVVPSRKN